MERGSRAFVEVKGICETKSLTWLLNACSPLCRDSKRFCRTKNNYERIPNCEAFEKKKPIFNLQNYVFHSALRKHFVLVWNKMVGGWKKRCFHVYRLISWTIWWQIKLRKKSFLFIFLCYFSHWWTCFICLFLLLANFEINLSQK